MVGDVVVLQEGMEIPADGIVLEAAELTTDESAMTGETGINMIYSLFKENFKKKYNNGFVGIV